MLDSLDPNTLRLGFFAGIFAIMATVEALLPKRDLSASRLSRWPTNWGIVVLDATLVRLIFPIGGIGLAVLAVDQQWGVFQLLGWQGLFAGLLTFFILDFAVWLQHWAAHKIPFLWRIHRVHHADGDMDVTTALRFHPIEILLSFVWKAAVILALGGPVWAVVVFEIVLNGAAMFNHANVALPRWLDRGLRWLIVTPDMHRVHHSARVSETDSNYGFNLSLWDRLFSTYTDQPQGGHDGMAIGLDPESAQGARKFVWSLTFPFHALKPKQTDQ